MTRREQLQAYLRDRRFLEQTVGRVRNALRREATRLEESDYLSPVYWQAWRARVLDALLALGKQAFARGTRTAERVAESLQMADDAPIPPEWEEWYLATVGDALHRYAQREQQRIADIIREGALQGWSNREIEARIQQVFVAMRTWQAERIARTETMRFYNLGHLQTYERQPLLVGYEYSVILDDRTSHICQQITGKRVRREQLRFVPPLHPHCRTVLLPLFRSDGVSDWDAPEAIESAVPPNFGNIERLPLPSIAPSTKPASRVPEKPLETLRFPDSLEELEEVRLLGGSTGARLMRDKAGNLWVWKEGADEEHVQLEHAAHEIYRAFGVDAPASQLYQRGDRAILLAEYRQGEKFSAVSGIARARAEARLREGLLIDALLENYDAIGLEEDNIIVAADGRVWRVDNGGSFWRRAQGGNKPFEGTNWDALWTLRGQADAEGRIFDSPMTRIMATVDLDELRQQLRRYEEHWDAVQERIATLNLPAELRERIQRTLRERWDTLRDIMAFAENMREAFRTDYSDRVVFWYQKFNQEMDTAARQAFQAERMRWKEVAYSMNARCRRDLESKGVESAMDWIMLVNEGLARQARTPVEEVLHWQRRIWQKYRAVLNSARDMVFQHSGWSKDRLAIRLSHLIQEVREGVPAKRFFQHEPIEFPISLQERESVAALHGLTQIQLRRILGVSRLGVWRISPPKELETRTFLGDLSTNAVFPRLHSTFPSDLQRLGWADIPTSQVVACWSTIHYDVSDYVLYAIPQEFEFTIAGPADFVLVGQGDARGIINAWLEKHLSETQRIFGE